MARFRMIHNKSAKISAIFALVVIAAALYFLLTLPTIIDKFRGDVQWGVHTQNDTITQGRPFEMSYEVRNRGGTTLLAVIESKHNETCFTAPKKEELNKIPPGGVEKSYFTITPTYTTECVGSQVIEFELKDIAGNRLQSPLSLTFNLTRG